MTTQAESGGIFSPQLRSLSVAILIATAVTAYDFLAVAAALPKLGDDLGHVELLPWVVTAFPMLSTIAVVASGPLIDSAGIRVVFRLSLIGFVIASLGTGLAPTIHLLIAARWIQGLSAGMSMAATLALVGTLYPSRLVPRAFAAQSYAWGLMGILGPTMAAVLVDAISWRWIFLVNVPAGLVALVLGWSGIPEHGAPRTTGDFDRAGLGLVAVAMVLVLISLQRLDLVSVPLAVVGLASGTLYWRRAGRIASPVVHRRHVAGFPAGVLALTMALSFGAALGVDAYLPLYVRGARGLSTGWAAFSVIFLTTGWSFAAFMTTRLLDRHGPTRLIAAGASIVTITLAVGIGLTFTDAPLSVLFALMTVMGTGVGLVTTAGRTLVQWIANSEEIGRANSGNQFIRTLGLAFGTAVAGGVLLLVVERRVGDVSVVRDLLGSSDVVSDPAVAEALAAGWTWAFVVATGVSVLATVLAVRLHARLDIGPPTVRETVSTVDRATVGGGPAGQHTRGATISGDDEHLADRT